MLYALAHFLRDKCPFIWDIIDWINSLLFSMRYGARLKRVKETLELSRESKKGIKVTVETLGDIPASEISTFFASQPEESFTYFRPHKFDIDSIRKLQRNRSFIAYVIRERNSRQIIGYFFLRSFFNGKAYRGRMVDVDYQNKGLGTLGNELMNEIGFGIGLKIYESVSRNNISSYKSSLAASNVKVIKELEHNEVLLEIIR